MKKIFSTIINITVLSYGLLLSSISFANDHDPRCDNLSGTWTGEATLKWYAFDCNYLSVARVGQGNPTIGEVSVAKSSGPFLCPSIHNQMVKVHCNAGVLDLKDEKLDVSGLMSDDGKYAELTGTLFSRVKRHSIILKVTKSS